MSHADRIRWEQRYAGAPPAAPLASTFIQAHAERLQGRILDIAAGTGRNALWLARRGATVHCIDIAGNGLRRALDEAKRESLAVCAVQADLESFPLPSDHYDAVVNVRYLQRSLFPAMRRTVRPGGLILFETFLLDTRAEGHPRNPDFSLRPGELAQAFCGFEFLHTYEGPNDDSDERTYVARMIARRPKPERD